MNKKFAWRLFGLILGLGLAAGIGLPALAGGWAVATLDSLPTQVVAGQSIPIGFTVRQHGRSPLDGLTPAIRIARPGEYGEVVAYAKSQGGGHYTAALVFPAAGEWNWSLETGFFPEAQPMPSLIVSSSGSTASIAATPVRPTLLAYGLWVVSGIGVVSGLLVLARTRAPWAAVVVLVAALIGGMGFASATAQATTPTVVTDSAPTYSQVETGQRLFVAKGCVVCHTHAAVADIKRAIQFNFDAAPNLTHFAVDPGYLAKWLDDPAAIRPLTEMPKLNLSDEEIGALVAFINAP